MSSELLDQFLEDSPAAARQPIAKVNYSHDGMINMILAHRGITQNQLAAHFGYTASWISQVMSSDAFKARLAERAAEIEDPTLRATVEEQIRGLHHRSLVILMEKLKAEPAAVPDNLALRTLEISSRALGYGAKDQTPQNTVNVHVHLDQLGGRLVDLLRSKKSEALEASAATSISE